ncbi:hypothetical protein PI125_g2908 [Phytophthora idaei]|nr:hypothetical protein PI125_g2908 [Phytophthora idaei]KAG3173697.1 hypothetical protein PI126_g756 [Phytophthora idaei]
MCMYEAITIAFATASLPKYLERADVLPWFHAAVAVLHNQSLHDLVDDETSGHYEFLPQLLSSPLPEAEAGILGKATKGLGTKEDLNYPVVVDHTNAEILTKTYYEMYGHGLGSVLDSDLHTDYKKAILA